MTILSEIPKPVLKWGKCLLLHKKIPMIDKNFKIIYVCKECQNDDDSPKDQKAS